MNLLSCIFTITVSLILPITAAIWLSAKKKGYLKPILLGAVTFTLFQILIRIPIIQLVLPYQPWYIEMNYTKPILSALFLGVSAALFEIGGRWLVMSIFMKNRHRTLDGIVFGVGHGGIEAVLLVGINILLRLIIFGGTDSTAVTFAAGAERIFTMIMQIAWSVMILKGISSKKAGWLLLAFVLHAFTDTAISITSLYGVSLLVVEAGLSVIAAVMLIFIFKELKNKRGLIL